MVSRRRPAARAARSRGSASTPTAMEAIVPSYLWRFRKTGQFKSRAVRVRRYFPSASAIRPSEPTITRHQANSAKPWRCT